MKILVTKARHLLILNRAENEYYNSAPDLRFNSNKQIRKTLNPTFNPNGSRRKSSTHVKNLTLENGFVPRDDLSIANSFNLFFSNVGKDLSVNFLTSVFRNCMPPSLLIVLFVMILMS